MQIFNCESIVIQLIPCHWLAFTAHFILLTVLLGTAIPCYTSSSSHKKAATLLHSCPGALPLGSAALSPLPAAGAPACCCSAAAFWLFCRYRSQASQADQAAR